MNLLTGLLVGLCLETIATAEGQRIKGKQNNPLATLQRLGPSIFGHSELSEEVTDPTTSDATGTLTSTKPATDFTSDKASTTKVPKHKNNLGIAKLLDSLNIDYIDQAIDNLKLPTLKSKFNKH